MIQFNFEDRSIKLPTEWDEVTVEHFCTPEFLSGNSLSLISSLSEIPIKKLANTTVDLTDKFEKVVKFIKKDPNGWMGIEATSITLKGVECNIPVDIELERFGQKIMVGELLNKSEYLYEAIPVVIAIYLGPQVYPDTWYDKIDELVLEVKKLPITKVYPIASFFLTLTNSLAKDGKTS